MDVTSSMVALYGLILLQNILMPLLHTHNIKFKFLSLQVIHFFICKVYITTKHILLLFNTISVGFDFKLCN